MSLRLNYQLALGAVAAGLTMCSAARAGALPERVERAARDRVEAGVHQSLVFGIVDGSSVKIVAFGRLDNGRAPDGDTVYEIGSITKTFTSVLLAQDVLAGRATLDTPVAQWLPDFKIPSRNGKEITLGLLASNHSGLPRMPDNFRPGNPANPYADYDAEKLKDFLTAYELPRDPGESYEYSNVGFGLLGHALAQRDAVSYGQLVGKRIFEPLGMTMSGVAFNDAMRANLASGHDALGKPVANWDLDALAGAGAIRSTANDLVRYVKANMATEPSALADAMKLTHQPRHEIIEGVKIGLGWMSNAKGIVWHSGGTAGYTSFAGFVGGRGVVVLSNTGISVDDLGFATLDPTAQLAPTYKAITLPGMALDAYVGTYQLTDKMQLRIFRQGDALFTQATGQGVIPILAHAPDEFFTRMINASISFTRDAGGIVTGLVLHQNGDHAAPKMATSGAPSSK